MGPNGRLTCKHCKTLGYCSELGYCSSCQEAGIKVLEDQKKFSHYPLSAKATGYNAAILKLTHQDIAKLVGLDESHIISDMIYDDTDRSRRTLRVIVQGPKMYEVHAGNELPWIDLVEVYERIGDPNLIRTTLSFTNVFTIKYKGEVFTTKLPLSIKALSDMMAFFANPHGRGEVVVETVEEKHDGSEPRITLG